MAEKGAESKNSLIIDYEAQLQSLIMWGGDSIPALKDYLDELNISLSPRDDRLIELIKVDIQRRASLTETPESTVLESVLRQFPDLTESQFCELALCEWQVWARRSPRLNTVQYAEQLRQLNRVSHAKLLALLTTHDELCGSASSRSDMFDCDRL